MIPPEEHYGSLAAAEFKPDSSIIANSLIVPMSSRSQSNNSDSSSNRSASNPGPPVPGVALPAAATASGSTIFRGRAKTLATITTPSKNPQTDMTPREMHLPKDPFVNGQPIEAYLYKDATECPICFLFYPPYLNKTRCCDQAICSECFVQIKRPDPHLPEHALPQTAEHRNLESEDTLISEPAACPFCVQPEFGVTYESPSFRRGLTYVNQAVSHSLNNASSAMSSSSSLASAISGGGRLSPTSFARRRTTSISASSPTVITTDRVRPDWHQKLVGARAHAARRSAAATALHTAAYLIGNRNETDARGFGSFGRRGILRRGSGTESLVGGGTNQFNMLALMSERYGAVGARGELPSNPDGESNTIASPRASSGRTRIEDIEEMMMMEAIRLSLASEEERRKREEKDAKKEAKKKEKENKKAEKLARKAGVYSISANQSNTGLESSTTESSPIFEDFPSPPGKGKGIQQTTPELSADVSSSSTETSSMTRPLPSADSAASGQPKRGRGQLYTESLSILHPPHHYRPSHLRNLSNASSSGSSVADSAVASLNNDFRKSNSSFEASPNSSGINILPRGSTQDTYISGTPPGGGAGLEPMFNFRSLAAMVGEDEIIHGEGPTVEHHDSSTNIESSNRDCPATTSNAESSSSDQLMAKTLHGISKLDLDRKGHSSFGDGIENMTPGLKITSPTRTNSYQMQDSTAGAVKSFEASIGRDVRPSHVQ